MSKEQIVSYNLEKIDEILKSAGKKNVFLLTGASSFKKSGAEAVINGISGDIRFSRHIVKSSNPKINEIMPHVKAFSETGGYDAAIAIGGGSVIDTLKCVKAFLHKENPIIKDLFFIAVPTTAGSGSEATPFAVYYDSNNKKQSIDAPYLLPDAVVLDSRTTASLPKYQKASCAMDAFCQGLESYWTKSATDISDSYAIEAMKIVLANIRGYMDAPDKSNCETMQRGAYLAGKAIAVTRTTLSHALSYTITSGWGIPHGHAVALTIGSVLKYNLPYIPDNKIAVLKDIFKTDDTYEIPLIISELMKSAGLETKLSLMGIDDIEKIANGINEQRLQNNPVIPSKQDIINILKEVA